METVDILYIVALVTVSFLSGIGVGYGWSNNDWIKYLRIIK